MIRIVIADDHPLLRQGVTSLIDSEHDMEIVAQAENGRQAIELVKEHKPALVILDIQMPELNGMSATREILQLAPETRVIALSSYGDRRFVAEMLKAGAQGYLLKDQIGDSLPEAIRAVMAGESYLSPAIQSRVIREYKDLVPSESVLSVLSEREKEILQLIAEGKENKEIGYVLHVSRKTIDTHRRHIMEKLDVHSVAELTKLAIREGLTPLQ